MVDILTQFEEFKAELKEKWLSYYQTNRIWLQKYMSYYGGWRDTVNSVKYDKEELISLGLDEGYSPCRPECYYILGVVSVLEPQIQGLLSFAQYLNTDSEGLVKTLGLDFDPEIELKKRSQQQ
jgi:hypothetical protein